MADAIDVIVRDKISRSIESKLTRIGTQANSASAAIANLNATLASNTGFTAIGNASQRAARNIQGVTNANRGLLGSFTSVFGGILGFNTRLTATDRLLHSLRTNIRATGQTLRSFASGILLLGAVGGALSKVDTYQNVSNQIGTTTDSQSQLNAVLSELFDVSNRARVPIDSLTKSYRRFDMALKSMGAGQAESLKLTETIGKLLTLSGSDSNEAASGLLQLSQAFNKGKLDGDEFRSVAELMPEVIDGITKTLGISRREIFAYSRQGKITGDVLRRTFADLAESVDAKIGAMPRTIGQAFTQLSNTVTKFFGELDKRVGITSGIVEFIDMIKNNLPLATQYLKAFGVAFAVFLAPAAVSLLGPITSFFLSISGLLAAAAGYMAFFSKEIKVTNDGLATLHDLVGVVIGRLPELIGNLTGFDLSEFFSAESAQKVYDRITELSSWFIDAFSVIQSASAALGESLFNSLFDANGNFSPEDILVEPFYRVFLEIKNGMIELVSTVVGAMEQPFIKLFTLIDQILAKIGEVIQAAGVGIKVLTPFSSAGDDMMKIGGSLGKSSVSLEKGVLTAGIDALKTDVEAATPVLTKFFDDFSAAYERNISSMKESSTSLWDSLIADAEMAAEKRIAIEQSVAEAMQLNPGALRGADPALAQEQAMFSELSRFDAAIEDLKGKSDLMKAVLSENSQFHDDFRIKTVESALATEGFSRQIIELGLGLGGANTGLQSAANNIQSVGSVASSALPQIDAGANQATVGIQAMGQQLEETKQRGQSFFQDMQAGFQTLMQDIQNFQQQATESLQNIGNSLFQSFDENGKFDLKKFLGAALPELIKYIGAKNHEKQAAGILGGAKQGAPGDVASGFFGLQSTAEAALPALETVNSALQNMNTALTTGSQIPPSPVTSLASPDNSEAISQSATAMQAIEGATASVSTSVTTLGQSVSSMSEAFSSFATTATGAIESVASAANSAGGTISSSITGAMQSATESVNSFAENAIAQFEAVAGAAAAVPAPGAGGGGGGGGGFLGGLFGFADGGYTGNVGRNQIAGIVHGQEFVMPADVTAKYRPILEAMRSGRSVGSMPTGGSGSGPALNVKVENYGSSKISVERLSATDIRIIAREEAISAARTEAPRAVAGQLANPNSKVSKSLSRNTKSERRR